MNQETQSLALKYLKRDRLVQLCADLVNIPSPTGQEGAVANYIAGWLGQFGIPVQLQEVEDARPNVIGKLKGSGGGFSLTLNAHMDTSFSGTEEDLLTLGEISESGRPQATVEEGTISGLGVNNDKGPLAAILEATVALKESGVSLDGDLVVAGVVGEVGKAPVGRHKGRVARGKGVGTIFLVNHGVVTDYALVAEPSSFAVTWALPGVVYLRLTTRGRSTYTSFTRRNEEGVSYENAIVTMLPVLKAIDQWGARYQKERRCRFPGGEIIPKVNIGAIEGGLPIKPNHSPAVCHAYLDVRVLPGVKPLDVLREVESVVAQVGASVEAEMYLSQHGCIGEGVEPLREAVETAHETVFGAPPPRISPEQTSMWNDVNVYNSYGIPSLKYGPSGIGTAYRKKREEKLAIDDLFRAAQVYLLAASTICRGKRST